jgi:hypothetical protein
MGFGFPSLSQSKATPFFTALTKASGQQGVMGSRFSRKSDRGSEITIGGVNPAAFVGSWVIFPLRIHNILDKQLTQIIYI